jgi:hypothetical protein
LQKLDSAVITLNNLLVRGRKKRAKPEEVLLLIPSCLQNSECKQNLVHDVWNCKRCGSCKVCEVLDLAESYGVKPFTAAGGRIALLEAAKKQIKAVVAVACEKELREGILAAFPKAVLAVVNLRPHGPCKDTSVNVTDIEEALQVFLGEGDKQANIEVTET